MRSWGFESPPPHQTSKVAYGDLFSILGRPKWVLKSNLPLVTLATKSTHPGELWRGYWGIQVLQVGQTLGLFEAFQEQQAVDRVARERGLEERYLQLWCEAAESFGLVEKVENEYRTPPEHHQWLVRSRGFTESHIHLSRRMNETLHAVFGGRALPEPPISLRLLLQENLQANYQWMFQEAAQAWPALAETLSGSSRVLEVGCGLGFGLSYLRDFHPALDLVGLEPDYECAQEAERTTKAVIHVGDFPAERLSKSFDLVVCFRALTASPDPQRLLKECSQLLNPRGLFLLGSELEEPCETRKDPARCRGERLAYNVLAGESLLNSFSHPELLDLLAGAELELQQEIAAPDWATPLFLCTSKANP